MILIGPKSARMRVTRVGLNCRAVGYGVVVEWMQPDKTTDKHRIDVSESTILTK